MTHIPVLTKEVLQYLDPKPNENFIDCTIGEGGHARLILEKTAPEGRLLAIDLDASQVENSKLRLAEFAGRASFANGSYASIKEITSGLDFKPVHGILLDLGYSSWQLEKSGRGFSFLKDEVLDMRYDAKNTLTAKKRVNEYPREELEKIIKEYGEEKFAKNIAKKIDEKRRIKKIETTLELVDIITEATPGAFRYGSIHCATRTFQALRIAGNAELDTLEKFLPDAMDILEASGRLAVISFHSLEDRIIKKFFKEREKEEAVKILTKKPVTGGADELLENPRARSAKLRAIM